MMRTMQNLEKDDFYCFEVKSSVEDFSSRNDHNSIGDYNYYVIPADVYAKVRDKFPYRVGVYIPTENQQTLKSVKSAKRMARAPPCLEMLFMMFRSSNRELLRTTEHGK